jgi:hypothetical protein
MREITATTTLTDTDIVYFDLVSVTTAGVAVTLPTPTENFMNRSLRVQNNGAGPITVSCPGYFLNSMNGVMIPVASAADFSCARVANGTYRWAPSGGEMAVMTSWTPTLTWGTADPTGGSTTAIYKVLGGKVVLFHIETTWTDGNAASSLTATLPIVPPDTGTVQLCPVTAIQGVATAYTNALGYIDLNNATAETRAKVQFKNFTTCTDAAAGSFVISGMYPIAGNYTDWDPTVVWTTSDPGSITNDSCYTSVDNVQFFAVSNSSADSNIASDAVCPLPIPTPDRDGYCAVASMELAGTAGATYSNPAAYVDCANSSDATRLIECFDFTQGTDAKAIAIYIAGFSEIGEWTSFDPTLTWTTGTPASITEAGRYIVVEGMCFFHYYLTSADGNGATALTITLPVGCEYGSTDIALNSIQLVDTTYSCPCAYINRDQMAASDRNKISFRNLSTATDAATVSVYVSGFYPVG